MENQIKTFYPKSWADYEMLDTGGGEKLERFANYTFVRPFETAFWKKTLSESDWGKADGKFLSSKDGTKKGWKMKGEIDNFPMDYLGIKFYASPTPFRHLGFFPEQASHWELIERQIKNSGRKIKFLNLFGYTGVASLFALRAGAEVTHLDASKESIEWAKENQKLAGMSTLPMRVIVDDALKFLEREAKRGNKYDAIVMDPPKFGRGPKGETWKLENDLPKLLQAVLKILSPDPILLILTSYSIDSSSLSLGYAIEETMRGLPGQIEVGELCINEKSNNRMIPLANTVIWKKD